MKLLAALRASTRGATVIEFAMLAPIFIAMLFGVMEGGRLFWARQTLNTVATATVRCMSVSSSCNTAATQQSYAVARAQGYGLRITAAQVTPTAATTCKGQANSNQVQITANFRSALRGFVPLPTTLTSTACFPVLT